MISKLLICKFLTGRGMRNDSVPLYISPQKEEDPSYLLQLSITTNNSKYSVAYSFSMKKKDFIFCRCTSNHRNFSNNFLFLSKNWTKIGFGGEFIRFADGLPLFIVNHQRSSTNSDAYII